MPHTATAVYFECFSKHIYTAKYLLHFTKLNMYLFHNTNLFMCTNLLIKQDDSTRQMPTFMPSQLNPSNIIKT
jgi:hypothetical protein